MPSNRASLARAATDERPNEEDAPGGLAWERSQLVAARSGDRQAFAALYTAFAARLYSGVLLPRLGDADVAQDALSETFQSLLRNLDRIELTDVSLWHWLARVAGNKANDLHRQRSRRDRLARGFESLMAPLWRGEQGEPAVLRRLEIVQGIERCLAAINPRYARALELRFLAGKSRQECATELEIVLGTFDVLLLRAVRAFRSAWTELLGEVA